MKFLKTAAIVIGAVALVATGVGLALGGAAATAAAGGATFLGMTGATLTTIGAIASIASAAIALGTSIFAPKPSFGSGAGSQLDFQTNPQSGLPYAIGRTRMSGLKIAGATAPTTPGGNNDLLFFAALLACTPAYAIESFTASNDLVTFDATTGAATSGNYASDWMAQKVSLGERPQASALSLSLDGIAFPGWTGAHKISGMPHSLWALKHDKDGNHYSNGVPEPAWIGKWALCYDPRKDSTYPGGSGSHRALDESTYEWTRNPGLHALNWAMGRWSNGELVCGIGAPMANIRVADFVECANVDDANAWGLGGVEWSSDAKWDVLKRMLQAGGAVPTKSGAMIGCRVKTPRISIGTIDTADFMSEIVLPITKPRRERFNTVLPRFPSEAHGWEVITGSEVTNPTFVTADRGRKRTKGIDFPLVQSEVGQAGFDGLVQVGQLAAYEIVDSREAGPIQFTTKPRWIGLHAGDCVTLNKPDDDIVNMKVVITGVTLTPSGLLHFTAETETDSKHAFALGKSTTPPAAPTLTVPAGRPHVPDAAAWAATPVALADGQAGIHVAGHIDDLIADRALVDYCPAGTATWRAAPDLVGTGPLKLDIGPIDSETDWDVRIAYSAKGNIGDFLEISGITTGPNGLAVGSLSSFLTNENHTVPADETGTVLSYAGATGDFKIYSGTADVSSLFTLSTQSNPQGLAVTYTGQSYAITGGLDAAEPEANLIIRATGGGGFTGVTIDKQFSLSKSSAGADGAPAKLLSIFCDRQTISYDGAGSPVPSTQTTTFGTNKQNTAATVTWSITDAAGNPRTPVTSFLSSATGDSVTMTEAQFASARFGTPGVIVTGTLVDGSTLTDRMSVVRVQAGAQGAPGAPGVDGAPGANGSNGQTFYNWIAYADDINGLYNFTTGAPDNRGFQGVATNKSTSTESTNPADYTWGPYRGPAAFGLVVHANVVVGQDYIVKTAGGSGWNASAYSSEAFIGGAFASFTAPATSMGGQLVGLNTDPATNASYDTIDFAFYCEASTGNLFAYENGTGTAVGTYAQNDALTIYYDGKRARYFKNGSLLRDIAASNGLRLYLDTSLADVGVRISGLKFGPVGAAGADGTNGTNGTNGTPGAPGANGATSYVHFAYADDATGTVNFTTGAAGGRYYVGVYVDFTVADSTNPADYTWSLQRGANGSNGTPGAPGANGDPSYVHIAYANNSSGTVDFDLSDPTGRTYIGVYTDFTLADSTNPAAYTWSLIKGADGAPGAPGTSPYVLTASPPGQIIKTNFTGTVNPGQLPRTCSILLMQGTTDVTASTTISLASATSGISASYSGGVLTITGADNDGEIVVEAYAGFMLVASTTVTVTRQADPAPPSGSGSQSGFMGNDIASTSFAGPIDSSATVILKANGSGQIFCDMWGQYYPVTGTARTWAAAAACCYRVAGSGSGWSYSAGGSGPLSSTDPGGEIAEVGDVEFYDTISGLTPGAQYELGIAARKSAGSTTTGHIDANFVVRQS